MAFSARLLSYVCRVKRILASRWKSPLSCNEVSSTLISPFEKRIRRLSNRTTKSAAKQMGCTEQMTNEFNDVEKELAEKISLLHALDGKTFWFMRTIWHSAAFSLARYILVTTLVEVWAHFQLLGFSRLGSFWAPSPMTRINVNLVLASPGTVNWVLFDFGSSMEWAATLSVIRNSWPERWSKAAWDHVLSTCWANKVLIQGAC